MSESFQGGCLKHRVGEVKTNMFTTLKTGPEFDALNQRLRELAERLVEPLTAVDENRVISSKTMVVGPLVERTDRFYRMVEGALPCVVGEQSLFHFDQGELIGLDSGLNWRSMHQTTDFAIYVDVYDKNEALKRWSDNPENLRDLMDYQALFAAMVQDLLACSVLGATRPKFQMRPVEDKEIIIKQGERGEDVYSMLQGRARVFVDDKQVGIIGENEIFGEMSYFTGEPRSATVQADGNCLILAFKGAEFGMMAQSNPTAMMEIAKSLSSRLSQMNKDHGG